jgi:hypothetical protein
MRNEERGREIKSDRIFFISHRIVREKFLSFLCFHRHENYVKGKQLIVGRMSEGKKARKKGMKEESV